MLLLTAAVFSSDRYALPSELYFAGARVPLEEYDVRSRLERVFNIYVYDRRGFFQNLIDKQNDYIPEAVRILAEFGLHPDYAYIIPAESEFDPTAKSSAQASGLWQLMPATAKMYGLRADRFVDERNHPAKAALAAAQHLSMLTGIFPDDPFLVLASYNNGDFNVRTTLEKQSEDSFWSVRSNAETELYVEKVILYKLILSDPEKFGFRTPEKENAAVYESCTIVSGPDDIPVTKICDITGISYREFCRINPHLNPGSYKETAFIGKYTSAEIFVPERKSGELLSALEKMNYIAGGGSDSGYKGSENRILEDFYEVKFNDNIESIAFRFRTDWKKLAADNGLKIVQLSSGVETAEIVPGQKLRIIR